MRVLFVWAACLEGTRPDRTVLGPGVYVGVNACAGVSRWQELQDRLAKEEAAEAEKRCGSDRDVGGGGGGWGGVRDLGGRETTRGPETESVCTFV